MATAKWNGPVTQICCNSEREVQVSAQPVSSPMNDSLFLPGLGPLELLCVVIVIADREGDHKSSGIIVVLV